MQYCTNNFWEDTFNFTFSCLSKKPHMDCGMASNFNIMSIYLTLILKIVSFVNTWILNSAHFSSTYDLRSTIENIVVMKVLWQPHIFIYQIYQLFNKRRNWKGCSWCKLLKRPWAEIRHHDSLVKNSNISVSMVQFYLCKWCYAANWLDSSLKTMQITGAAYWLDNSLKTFQITRAAQW